jgi:hypothetical protein
MLKKRYTEFPQIYTAERRKRNLHLDEAFLKEDLNHLLENWKQARMVDANTSLQ